MKLRNIATAAAVALGGLAAMAGLAQAGTVTGTVTYRERIAVPPNAELTVELHDVSKADVASVRLSSQRYALDRVPFPFALTYDDSLIDDRMSYAVQARIEVDGKVLYRSTTSYPVLTRDASNSVDIVVERMADSGAQAPSLAGQWQVSELKGRLMVSDKRPTIEFQADGAFGGSTGCNRYRGTAEIGDDGTLAFSDNIAATLMACPPPLDQLERDYLEVLGQVESFVVNGDNLAMVNGAGVTVARFMRMQ